MQSFDKQPLIAPPHLFTSILRHANNEEKISDSHFLVNSTLESENASFSFLPATPHVLLFSNIEGMQAFVVIRIKD